MKDVTTVSVHIRQCECVTDVLVIVYCYIASAFSTRTRALDSNARSHWLNQGHVNEFKSNDTRLVNISKTVDQPVNIAVAL